LKPALANNSNDPTLKKPFTHKKGGTGGVAQGVGPEFKPSSAKEKKKKAQRGQVR
jgi:hypothetical protein